jgi:hypothetical protein
MGRRRNVSAVALNASHSQRGEPSGFAHYNFVRQHKTLRITPAMAAGVEKGMWDLRELVGRTTA